MINANRKWFFLNLFNQGFDTLEIAKRCNVSEAAVYNGIHRAKEYSRQIQDGGYVAGGHSRVPKLERPNFRDLGLVG